MRDRALVRRLRDENALLTSTQADVFELGRTFGRREVSAHPAGLHLVDAV